LGFGIEEEEEQEEQEEGMELDSDRACTGRLEDEAASSSFDTSARLVGPFGCTPDDLGGAAGRILEYLLNSASSSFLLLPSVVERGAVVISPL
jgi:hypothetical protein